MRKIIAALAGLLVCATAFAEAQETRQKLLAEMRPQDGAFFVDFMNEINHQVIKRLSLKCGECGKTYEGMVAQLGEA